MPMMRYGSATVVESFIQPKSWEKLVCCGHKGKCSCGSGTCRTKVARTILAKYSPEKYLLSHCTIVAAVDVDEAKSSKSKYKDYLIKPAYSKLVNNNGDAWTKNLLAQTYRSFIGANNYLEHVQIAALSKGKVVDAALREVPLGKDKDGKDLTTYYVDILVATEKKHKTLVADIQSGKMKTLSMGCGPAGTKIIDYSGRYINIEDIVEGDKVITHTGNIRHVNTLFKKEVLGVPLYSIKAVGLYENLKLTGEHPILIASLESVRCLYKFHKGRPCKIDNNQVQCSYPLNNGLKCAGKKRPCGRDKNTYKYDIEFKPIADVKKGDYLVKSFPVEIVDDERFNKDICRLIGMYIGDGYIGWQWKDKKKQYPAYVGFCISLKEGYLKDQILKLKEKISPYSHIMVKEVVERNGLYINIYDKDLASLFYSHCKEGAWNKELSSTLMQLPLDKQLEIIGGMFDTDGGFEDKDKSLYYTTASVNLWNQLHLLLLRSKIPNAHERVWRKATGKKSGKEKYWQMTINVQKGSNSVINTWKNKNYGKDLGLKNDLCFFYKDYYLTPIKKITQSNFSGMVYNFSVEEDESYLINNIAVHNCKIAYSICTKCGNKAVDETDACEHVKYEKNNTFYDDEGVQRKVAELCGHADDPDSVTFVDASWVANPAFTGAVIRNVINPSEDIMAKIEEANKKKAFEAQEGDFLKAANKIAQDPPAEDPKDPPEDAPADTPEDAPADTPEDAPADTPEEMPPEPESEETDYKKWKKDVKEKILKELTKELTDEFSGEESRPEQLETLDESLIQPCASASVVLKQMWKMKRSWDAYLQKTAGSIDNKNFEKLKFGTYMLLTSNDLTALADYGYTRRDFLAVMSFLDQSMKKPLAIEIKKAIAQINGTNDLTPQKAVYALQKIAGRKLSQEETEKSLVWLKLMDSYKEVL